MEGIIFNIQRFSIHDGPGIRTTVFLKGCNLQCFWCHNPESVSCKREIQFFPDKCIGCGKCFIICPVHAHQVVDGQRVFRRELCTVCGRCAETCFSEALTIAGKIMTVEEIMQEVEKDRDYYERSGGGITFSGGEPLLQKKFLYELLRESQKRGFHTAVDTAGNVPWETFEHILPYTDMFLFDIKLFSDEKHRNATKTGCGKIHENIKRLAESGSKIWVRVPVIPGTNDDMEEMNGIASLIKKLDKIERIELLPFHKMGGSKYKSLGREYMANELEPPGRELMDRLVGVFRDNGLNVTLR